MESTTESKTILRFIKRRFEDENYGFYCCWAYHYKLLCVPEMIKLTNQQNNKITSLLIGAESVLTFWDRSFTFNSNKSPT